MSAAYDFRNTTKTRAACEQGATFKRRLALKDSDGGPVALAGYTARMQVRATTDSTSSLVALTTENGRIVVDGTAGTVLLQIAAVDTAAMPAGAYVYDLELVSGSGEVQRLLEGAFVVTRNVTR